MSSPCLTALSESSDSDDDAVLSFTPFSRDTARTVPSPSQRSSASPSSGGSSQLMTPVALEKVLTPLSQESRGSCEEKRYGGGETSARKSVDELTEEEAEARALCEANAVPLPMGMDGILPSHLKWLCRRKYGSTVPVQYWPCIVMKKSDTVGLSVSTTFNEETCDVVQNISFRYQVMWEVKSKTQLLHYGEGVTGRRRSAKRKRSLGDTQVLAESPDGADTTSRWNPCLCDRFMKHQMRRNPWKALQTNPKVYARAHILFLQRILDRALDNLEKSRPNHPHTNPNPPIPTSPADPTDPSDQEEPPSDLEEPYSIDVRPHAAPAAPASDASDASDSEVVCEGRSTEPLRPGDVITYWSPLHVMGDPRGRRETTVLATRPRGEPVLSLANGECLPADTQVRRVRVFKYGKVREHSCGVFRRINQFKMTEASRGTEELGVVTEAERVGRAVARGRDALIRSLEEEGGPQDLVSTVFTSSRNRKRKEDVEDAEGAKEGRPKMLMSTTQRIPRKAQKGKGLTTELQCTMKGST